MKKRIPVILVLALLMGLMTFSALAQDEPARLNAISQSLAATPLDFSGDRIPVCPVCGVAPESWTALDADITTSWKALSGHYYLTSSRNNARYYGINSGTTCLYLNGYDITTTGATAFEIGGGTLNVFGQGNVRGNTDTYSYGAAIAIISGKVNLCGGTYSRSGTGGTPVVTAGYSSSKSNVELNIFNGVTITGGSNPTRDGGGVGVYNKTSVFNMYGGTITGSSALNGGNIYVESSRVNIYGGTISNGTATAASGTSYGGNIHAYNSNIYMYGGTISGGRASSGKDGRGGNLALHASNLYQSGGTISGGSAVYGGNAFCWAGPIVRVTGGTVENGVAGSQGGNLMLNGGELTITGADTKILGGQAGAGGGSLYVYGGNTCTITDATISGGKNTISNGGGNLAVENANCTITGATFQNGDAGKSYGGNLFLFAAASGDYSVTVSGNTRFEGGKAERGGNIASNGVLNLNGATITGGTATVGGNIYVTKNSTGITINNCVIENGAATTGGGNGYFSGPVTATNSAFNQTAGASGSGTQYYNDSTVSFTGCTFTNGTVMEDMNVTLTDTTVNISNFQVRNASGGGFLTLAGNTNISKLTMAANTKLHVSSTFTGEVNFASPGSMPEAPMAGKMMDANYTADGDFAGKLICSFDFDKPWTCHKDGGLMISSSRTVKDGVVTWYADNEAAIRYYGDADYIWPAVDGAMVLNGNYTVDLSGTNQTITGTGAVTLFDSANADFETYGTATVNGPTVANTFATQVQGNTYYMVSDGNTHSFHRMGMDVSGVSVRPSQAGFYYTDSWKCDTALQALVKNYGVAVSVDSKPDTTFATNEKVLYTQYSGQNFAGEATKTGVLIKDIFKTTAQDNAQRGATPIYASAYVTFNTPAGDVVAVDTENQNHSLRTVLAMVDSKINDYSASAQTLKEFMMNWNQYGVTGSEWNFTFAVPEEIVALNAMYAGMTAYQGEAHDHAATGGRADGKQSLTTWVNGMKKLKMDFAVLVDHDQSRHMYLEEWDDAMFIGGTETTGWLTEDHLAGKSGQFHMNLIFAEADKFEAFINEYKDVFKPVADTEVGGVIFLDKPHAEGGYTHLPESKEFMLTLAERVHANGGFFVHVHPKQLMASEDPLDYWFGDFTGIEVQYTYGASRDSAKAQANYKLWTDLLALGKKVYATAGNDDHDMPTVKALTTIYAPEKSVVSLVEQMREGNFNPGPIGIRMAIGNTPMGKVGSFAGNKLAFVVGDIHESELKPDHVYRVDLFCGSELVQSFDMPATGEYFYQVVEIDENADFYRLEVIDVTANSRVALSQPIWNEK